MMNGPAGRILENYEVMLIILWEYRVRNDSQADFERAYGSDGIWACFFREGAGYLGTELLVDRITPNRYLTIDRWHSRADFETFRESRDQDYQDLDRLTERLTDEERLVGFFETVKT